jgi:hypothetical protein
MAKAKPGGRVWISGLAAFCVSLAVLQAVPALAQETPGQFDAANAEARRHSEQQNQLRNQAHDLRQDRANALLSCQGAGSAAAQGACNNNAGIGLRQRGLSLDNQVIQERNNHNQILQGLGVHRVP